MRPWGPWVLLRGCVELWCLLGAHNVLWKKFWNTDFVFFSEHPAATQRRVGSEKKKEAGCRRKYNVKKFPKKIEAGCISPPPYRKQN